MNVSPETAVETLVLKFNNVTIPVFSVFGPAEKRDKSSQIPPDPKDNKRDKFHTNCGLCWTVITLCAAYGVLLDEQISTFCVLYMFLEF